MAPSVVHVQSPIGIAWLLLYWHWVLAAVILAVPPMYLLVRRWRSSVQRSRALFDYTLAETLRKQGDAKASMALYDKILVHDCPEQLIWRCHNGRSQALLARGDAAAALLAANTALELAHVQAAVTAKAQAQADSAAAKKASAAANVGASSSAPSTATAAVVSDPDSDPFLSLLPSISFALLHYNRGLVLETLPGPLHAAEASADFARAAEIDPDLDFCPGQRARMEMNRRIEQNKAAAASAESKEGVEGKIDAEEEAAEAAKATSMNQRRSAAAAGTKQ